MHLSSEQSGCTGPTSYSLFRSRPLTRKGQTPGALRRREVDVEVTTGRQIFGGNQSQLICRGWYSMLMAVGHLSGGAHLGRRCHLMELYNISTSTKTLATTKATLMPPLLPLVRILHGVFPPVMSSSPPL
jgi:hypothetical protein